MMIMKMNEWNIKIKMKIVHISILRS